MDIIILTKSCKNNNYCVAGINEKQELVRLGIDNKAEIPSDIFKYNNGKNICIGDMININEFENSPLENQPENIIIDIDKIKFIRQIEDKELLKILERRCNKNRYIFFNDKEYIEKEEIKQNGNVYSLDIVMVNDINIYIKESYGKRKSKADFYYNDIIYRKFSITDSDYFNYNKKRFSDGKFYLVVSLADKLIQGKYYKFIAKIFKFDNK